MNLAALRPGNLGKQMLFDVRICVYRWNNLFITGLWVGDSFVTNAKRDYYNSIKRTDDQSKAD